MVPRNPNNIPRRCAPPYRQRICSFPASSRRDPSEQGLGSHHLYRRQRRQRRHGQPYDQRPDEGCRVDGREGFRACCLNDPNAVVTCLSNDFSYEDVFAIQLRTLARRGDLLIVFSGSGNSPNILRACETAREMGMTVIGFGGRDGGKMKALCHICCWPPPIAWSSWKIYICSTSMPWYAGSRSSSSGCGTWRPSIIPPRLPSSPSLISTAR